VLSILKAREDGPFKEIFDFCARVDRRLVNKRAMEALVKSGAFDETHSDGKAGRAQLVAAIDVAVRMAEEAAANADQVGLFGDEGGAGATGAATNLPAVAPYSARDTLLEEKLALGYCFSGSLFDSVAQEVRRFAATPLARAMPTKDPIWIAGVVTNSRAQMTRRGMMRVIELDDGSGRMEVTVFNELYDARKHVLRVDDVLIINAKIDNDEYSGGLRGSAVEILTLAEARGRHARAIRLALPADQGAETFIATLKQLVGQGTGTSALGTLLNTPMKDGCPILLEIQQGQQVCELRLPDLQRLEPSETNLSQLRSGFGETNVSLDY
jgi:DNA polymerase-3 subunit alpha